MRTFSEDTNMLGLIAGPTVTGAFLVKITRTDEVVFRFTTFTSDLVYDSQTYLAGHVSLSKIMYSDDLSADSLDIAALITTDGITEDDIARRRFSNAQIEIRLVDYTDTSTNAVLFTGNIGAIPAIEEGIAKLSAKSLRRILERKITSLYSPTCRAKLGDDACGLDLDSDSDAASWALRKVATVSTVTSKTEFTINIDHNPESGTCTPVTDTATTISAVAPSGDVKGYLSNTVAWSPSPSGTSFMSGQTIKVTGFTNTACNGTWRIVNTGNSGKDLYVVGLSQGKTDMGVESAGNSITVSVDASYTPSGYYSHGSILFYTGLNDNLTYDIRKYTANGDNTGTIKLMFPTAYEIHVGDSMFLYAGCDGRRGTCLKKFDNVLNFRGEPDLPGMDAVQKYPDHEPMEVDLT